MDDEVLQQQVVSGDEKALIQFLKRHEDAFYRIAWSYVKNEADALDAVQEMTVQLLTHKQTIQSAEYLKTWCVRTLIHCCLRMKEKERRRRQYDEANTVTKLPVAFFEVNEAIEKLPISEQQLIYLKYFHDYTNQSIAEVQKIPEGTVKSRLHKALRKMRHFLTEGGQRYEK